MLFMPSYNLSEFIISVSQIFKNLEAFIISFSLTAPKPSKFPLDKHNICNLYVYDNSSITGLKNLKFSYIY